MRTRIAVAVLTAIAAFVAGVFAHDALAGLWDACPPGYYCSLD